MTQKMKSLSLVTFMCGLVLFLGSCKVEEPPVVYNPNDQGGGSPEITGVTPPNVAYAGVTEVKLTGKNFSSVDTLNSVYFDNKKANVLAASSTELTVLAPDLISDSAVIRVAVAGAFAIATYGPYKLAPVTTEYGGFFGLDEVYSIAMDSSENLYAQLKDSAKVFKVTPTGNKTLYGRASFPKASDMKIGPGDTLYLQQTNSTQLHRILPGGGYTSLWVTLPGRASSIDFDSSGNIYAGGSGGMFVVNPNASTRPVGSFGGMTIKSVRVYAGYVYAAVSAPTAGVWKSKILNAQGDLGASVLAFKWTQAPGTFPSSQVLSLTFSADGDMYIGSDNQDPILVVKPDSTAQPLYPAVLKPPAQQLAWGNGIYLYVNRYISLDPQLRRVIRVAAGKLGAPEYGWR